MLRSLFPKLAICLFALACAPACAPSVGDSCETSAECPRGAICDVTAPGGYCYFDGCDTESCPPGTVCVEFNDEEQFCMEYCEGDQQCRNDYVCRDDVGPAPFCYVPPITAD